MKKVFTFQLNASERASSDEKIVNAPSENLYGHDWLHWSVRRWQRSKSCQWWHQPDFTFYLETIISKRMTPPKRNEIFFKRKWWISESCHYFTIKLKVPFYFWGHFWHIGTTFYWIQCILESCSCGSPIVLPMANISIIKARQSLHFDILNLTAIMNMCKEFTWLDHSLLVVRITFRKDRKKLRILHSNIM